MEAKAIARHVRMSPRKVRTVANMIRGKNVGEAMGMLRVLPKASALVFRKLLTSATANADDRSKGKVDVDSLIVKTVEVNCGPILKRWMPRSMGRANRINHRTSHVEVVVAEQE